MSSFWSASKKPLIALAPMEDVTDTVFREIVLRSSQPDALHLMMTEFVNTDGMMHKKGRPRVIHRLKVNDSERTLLKDRNVKLVAQIWGNKPAHYTSAIQEITDSGDFDGIDINMGCPVPKVVRRGECSGLIGNPRLAQELILAAQAATHLPISVKTRLGLKQIHTEEWLGHILETKPAAITLHGRIQKQMSDGLADWDEISKAARLRDQLAPEIPLLGNGDVLSLAEAQQKAEAYRLDGIMIGRGIFKNPWLFNPDGTHPNADRPLELLLKHTELFDTTWGSTKNFHLLRRYYSIYCAGFPGAAALRARLMQTQTVDEVRQLVNQAS